MIVFEDTCINELPTSCDVPVARPTTDGRCGAPFIKIHNCPASDMLET